jgi:hypothetical protein
MTVSRIQSRPNPAASSGASAKPRPHQGPQGLAQMPDRLEPRRTGPQEPPSFFKEFLFKPLFQVIKFLIRGIFTFIDFLRNVSFEETPEPIDREGFLGRLSRAPRPEKILHQFEEIYTTAEQNQVYHAIGEAHPSKTSWKEAFWDRSPQENIALGRRLVRQNPFLLRDYLT